MASCILAIVCFVFAFFIPGIFLTKKNKWVNLPLSLLFSFVFNTILWYWLLSLLKDSLIIEIIVYFLFSSLFVYIWRKLDIENSFFLELPKSSGKVLTIIFIIICIIVLGSAFLLYYPLLKPIYFSGYKFFRFPGIEDSIKHLFVVASIKEGGIPPINPYFPKGELSYYYGYYILPAVISLFSGVNFKLIYFIYYLLSIFLYLSTIYCLVKASIDSTIGRALALLFSTIGFGWDIIPTMKIKNIFGSPHIEGWSWSLGSPLQITSFLTAVYWVPQHLIAALASLVIMIIISKNGIGRNILPLSFLISFVLLNSIFVGLALIFFLSINFIYNFAKSVKAKNGTSVFLKWYFILINLIGLIIFPFIKTITGGRSNFLHLRLVYPTSAFPYFPNFPPLNFILSMIFEFGSIIFLVVFGIFNNKIRKINSDLFLLSVSSLIILIIIHFIVSLHPNDFGMRIILLPQLCFSFFAAAVAGEIYKNLNKQRKKLLKTVFMIFLSASLLFSFSGGMYEMYNRWKERRVVKWDESQLSEWIIQNTNKDQKLAFFENKDSRFWSELIPSVTGRMVYSLYLHGSAVYSTDKDNQIRDSYIVPIKRMIDNEDDFEINTYLTAFDKWLKFSSPDFLVFRKKVWNEADRNPYAEILKQLFPNSFVEIGDSIIFDYNKLIKKNRNLTIFSVKNLSKKIIPISKEETEIYLNKNLYLVKTCFSNNLSIEPSIEVSVKWNYRLFIDRIEKGNSCLTRIFFAPESKNYYFLAKDYGISENNPDRKTVLDTKISISFQEIYLEAIPGK